MGICLWIFKIKCFKEYLVTTSPSIFYFGTINLNQSNFCTTYSFKMFNSEQKYKNNLKYWESQKKKKKIKILKYIIFMWCSTTNTQFTQQGKNTEPVTKGHFKSSPMRKEHLYNSKGFSFMQEETGIIFLFFRSQIHHCFKMW